MYHGVHIQYTRGQIAEDVVRCAGAPADEDLKCQASEGTHRRNLIDKRNNRRNLQSTRPLYSSLR